MEGGGGKLMNNNSYLWFITAWKDNNNLNKVSCSNAYCCYLKKAEK